MPMEPSGDVTAAAPDTAAAFPSQPPPTPPLKYHGWKTMPFLIGNETLEKLATIATAANLLVYLTTVFHMSSVAAATTLNVFNGTINLGTVVGAFLSDAYFGRYIVLAFACFFSLIGMFILTLTAAIPNLHPPHCNLGEPCAASKLWQLLVVVFSFIFLIIGSGGIRPCNLPFGADQFDPTTESGKKGIASFFNWYYFTLTIAVCISSTVIIYIQTNLSWALGFAIPAVLMLFSCVFFFAGTKIYVKVKPEGTSPFTSIGRVFVAAFLKRRLDLPENPKASLFDPPHVSSVVFKLSHTDQFKFLDKASLITSEDELNSNGSAGNPCHLSSMQQVEEVKCLMRIIPIWTTNFLYNLTTSQLTTYVVLQALQSDRRFGRIEIPAASFNIFPMLALTIWIPLYDRIILPLVRKSKRWPEATLLQKMGVGIVLSVASMIVSGLIEELRRSYALRYPPLGISAGGGRISSMSAFWFVPQLVLVGLSEAFNQISQLEFYYKQFPENMRSVAGALFFAGAAISGYSTSILINVVNRMTQSAKNGDESWLAQDLNKGKLDLFYYLIAAAGAVNFGYFLVCAKWFRYKDLSDSSSEKEKDQKSCPA